MTKNRKFYVVAGIEMASGEFPLLSMSEVNMAGDVRSVLWTWTHEERFVARSGVHPDNCDEARELAAPIISKSRDASLVACHHRTVLSNESGPCIDLYITWLREDYELLREFYESPAGIEFFVELGPEVPTDDTSPIHGR